MNHSQTIKIYQPYTLTDLDDIWKSGWENYGDFCKGLGFRRNTATYGDDKSKNYLLHELTEEIVDTHIMENRRLVFIMPLNMLYNELYPKEEPSTGKKRRKTKKSGLQRGRDAWDKLSHKYLKALLENLIQCNNINDAQKKTLKSVVPDPKKIPSWLDEDIEKHHDVIPVKWKPAFELLLKAVNDEITEPEAFWNCVWMFTEIELTELKLIEKTIHSDIPLTEDQFDTINGYLGYGTPRGYWLVESNGKKSYEIYLDIEEFWINMHDLSKVTTMVLVQPAFQIAQLLQHKTSTARYTFICRAPSCNKAFYTGREDATACPGSQDSKKNKCALEWIRYKRYLKKIGKDPEQEWKEKANQEAFLKYDNS